MLSKYQEKLLLSTEKVRIQKAIDDSLKALDQITPDSTLVAITTQDNSENVIGEVVGTAGIDSKMDETANSNLNNEIVDPKVAVGVKKADKLVPLWDPRRHFN